MKTIEQLLLLSLATFLISCGSGSSSDPVVVIAPITPPPVGGVVRSGITFGPISGFGSVIVNGVHYDTSGSTFIIDDNTGSETDLKVGHIVTMKTETDDQGNASATEIIFDDEVQGPIESIVSLNSSLVVLGQLVIIDGGTSFDNSIQPTNLEGLSVGDIIEVSGLINSDGAIVASRLEAKSAAQEFEVHGIISLLDDTAKTFMLNDLAVNYANATLDDFGAATPVDGDLVEVKGTSFDSNGALIATKVELENPNERVGNNDDDAEIEGFITVFTSAQSFSVAGVPVITNSSTEFRYGTSADLALNVRVEVDGIFNTSGVLVADEVEFEDEANVEVTTTLDSVDAGSQSFTIYGINFIVDGSTRFEDKSDAGLAPFGIANLNSGDYLEVRGFERDGQLYASLVEREDSDTRNEIQGLVESVGTDSLVILGVTINTNGSTQYQDFDDSSMLASEFFELVSTGSLVKARGTKTAATSMLAEQLEFEN